MHVPRGFSAIVLLFAVSILVCIQPGFVFATPDPHLTGGSSVTAFSGSPASISDVQVTGTGNPTVPVKLHVTSGSLTMSTTTGLTFTGGTSGATLQFTGSMTDVNAALATLTYTKSGTGTDTLEASLVQPGEVFFADSGHIYEYVSYVSDWNGALSNAATRTKYGATGYLTTIASQAENDFVAARLSNAGWMGASDSASEGVWKWVAGPETGTNFWNGASGGSVASGQYANWGTGEPNDSGSNEDCAQFLTGGTGKWNDLPCSGTTLPGYVVEYGSVSSPIDVSSLNVSITINAANQTPNVPSSLGGSTFVDGSSHAETSMPTLSFTLTDPDGSDTVKYRIQIDDSSDFSSPVVDYTSSLAAQGSTSYVVGQLGGTYTVGSAGMSLPNGSYYWRVKNNDNNGAISAYTTARSGQIAFELAVIAPTPIVRSFPAPVPLPAKTCTDVAPTSTPDLFQIDGTPTAATIHFSPVPGAVTDYYVAYGYIPGDKRFGVSTGLGQSTGVLSYTIKDLSPDTTYYFTVRTQNGCKTGPWGNELQMKTTKTTVGMKILHYRASPIKKSIPPVLRTSVLGIQTSDDTDACIHVVSYGDTLWNIARETVGDPKQYTEIMKTNGMDTSTIRVGQRLKVGCYQ